MSIKLKDYLPRDGIKLTKDEVKELVNEVLDEPLNQYTQFSLPLLAGVNRNLIFEYLESVGYLFDYEDESSYVFRNDSKKIFLVMLKR